MNGWRARLQDNYLLDQVSITIGLRTDTGFQFVKPMQIEFTDVFPLFVQSDEPEPAALTISLELAEILLNVLANRVLGLPSAGLVGEVQSLRRALARAENRVDQLIAGIGARATIEATENDPK